MAQAEVVSEHYAHHNPIKFKSQPKDRQLYWANRNWRSDRRGWGQLKPVKTTDPDYEELKKHLSEVPHDLDVRGDGYVHFGDLILCSKSMEEVERSNQRRHFLANRKIDALKKGTSNPMADELNKLRGQPGTEYLLAEKPEFRHARTGEPSVIKSGVGKGR